MLATIKITLVCALFCIIVLTGCGKRALDPDWSASDGNAGLMASEVNNMGSVALDFNNINQNVSKILSTVADTFYIDVVIKPWHYDSVSNAWVREGRANYPSGERVRKDTIYFKNALGQPVLKPSLETVASIVHNRSVVRTHAGNETNIDFHMEIVLNKNPGDTTAVKNGTVVGSYNGDQFRSCTVTNVTRRRVNGHWQFPESGTIYINRLLRTISIEFKGAGQATAVITRKRDDHVVIINIEVTTGEETES